jgi:hypothetical protein
MRIRIWTVAAGLGAIAALLAVPSALAAYSSTKLQITQTGATVVAKVTSDPSDDPTAAVRVFAPAGTQLTTNQAPGTRLGSATAVAKALALAGADVPLQGPIVVATPGQVSAATQAACLQGATPLATWVMALEAAGRPAEFPLFLVATTGTATALGPAYVQLCLPPPDIPVSQGGAPFGLKLYSATLSVTGVFSPVSLGAWIGFWTPYTPGTGQANVAGTIATPAAVAPGAVSITKAVTSSRGATLSGAVTQAGQPRGSAAVTIFGGSKATGLKRLGKAKVAANGKFAFRAKSGTFFRADAVALPANAPPLCTQLGPALGVPCANPTVAGFTAKSKVVRKK